MEADFWHELWSDGRIAFHEGRTNHLLERHVSVLGAGGRVFVPLCGKARDMHWLAAQGHEVIGVELSERAARDFFEEAGLSPSVTEAGAFKRLFHEDITILVGDFFDLTPEDLGAVDRVYDRAALVALPEAMRARYARHLVSLSGEAPQLVMTFVYDQGLMSGPPFSVTPEMVLGLYGEVYTATALEVREVTLKGIDAEEHAWSLRKA